MIDHGKIEKLRIEVDASDEKNEKIVETLLKEDPSICEITEVLRELITNDRFEKVRIKEFLDYTEDFTQRKDLNYDFEYFVDINEGINNFLKELMIPENITNENIKEAFEKAIKELMVYMKSSNTEYLNKKDELMEDKESLDKEIIKSDKIQIVCVKTIPILESFLKDLDKKIKFLKSFIKNLYKCKIFECLKTVEEKELVGILNDTYRNLNILKIELKSLLRKLFYNYPKLHQQYYEYTVDLVECKSKYCDELNQDVDMDSVESKLAFVENYKKVTTRYRQDLNRIRKKYEENLPPVPFNTIKEGIIKRTKNKDIDIDYLEEGLQTNLKMSQLIIETHNDNINLLETAPTDCDIHPDICYIKEKLVEELKESIIIVANTKKEIQELLEELPKIRNELD